MSAFDLIFLRPLWVLALPVLGAALIWRYRQVGRPGDWQAQIQPHLLSAMSAMGRVELGRSKLSAAYPFLIAIIVVVALMGPALQKRGAETFRNLDGVVFVVDVSGSMVQDAAWPKFVNMARAGLSVLGSKPAALIVYAGDAYLASPLTTDHQQLGQTISLLDAQTVPDRGNRPVLALEQAADVLMHADILAGDVVFFTDGESLGPEAFNAVARITSLGGRLSVVAAQTTVSAPTQDNTAQLDALAEVGDGRVYAVDDLRQIMADLEDGSDARLKEQALRLLFLMDYGRYLLFFALFPALMFFRRERG